MSIRVMARAALVLSSFVGVTLVGAGAAHAGPEPPCVMDFCNGQNPVKLGCSVGAEMVNEITYEDHAAGGTSGTLVVRLMYSPTCNASWARVTGSGTGTATITKLAAWVGGEHKAHTIRVRWTQGTVVSKMWFAESIEVCGKATWNSGAVRVKRCTSAG